MSSFADVVGGGYIGVADGLGTSVGDGNEGSAVMGGGGGACVGSGGVSESDSCRLPGTQAPRALGRPPIQFPILFRFLFQ